MITEKEENICKDSVFERIYNNHFKEVRDFLYYKFGERFNPNDKAQDAFIKLWDNCKKISPLKAKSYLFTVANNMMLNEVKHQKVVLKFSKQERPTYTNETPEFLFEEEQFGQRYQSALSNLTEEQRVAFMLNKVEGKKHNEIAEMLGVTRKVVEYRIYSAFQKIKDELKEFNI